MADRDIASLVPTLKSGVGEGGLVGHSSHPTTTPLFKGWCGGGGWRDTTTSLCKPIWVKSGGA